MRNCVLITCDNEYIPKAIVALKQFKSKNPAYDMIIFGKVIKQSMHNLCQTHSVRVITKDLSSDFTNLDKRNYGSNYPIECFYHFYAYKILTEYDYIVLIEPDIYTMNTLSVNFSTIKYIGCPHGDRKIHQFDPIMVDYVKIQKNFGHGNLREKRVEGGVKIYNVKNLLSTDFYEKIVYYYKRSITIKAQRNGDDSLFTLFQMYNRDKITLLGNNFQKLLTLKTLTKLHENLLNRLTFVHTTTLKYWNNIPQRDKLARYVHDKSIEFLYNTFDNNFIKEYFSKIYRDTSSIKIPFYFWNDTPNFGDQITPYFLNRFCKQDVTSTTSKINDKKIISCGSIMRLCNKKTIVYGSGIRDINQPLNRGIIKVVRGPLTRQRLSKIGCYCPPTYGDPGLLLPLYYSPKVEKTYKLGIVPHYSQYDKVLQLHKHKKNWLIINLQTNNVEDVIRKMLSCEKIVSSSLHGLIVSDAYNIPNMWVEFDKNIKGDRTKFFDYFLSVRRANRNCINCLNYSPLPENVTSLIKQVKISFDFHKLKEDMFFDESGIKSYTKYLFSQL